MLKFFENSDKENCKRRKLLTKLQLNNQSILHVLCDFSLIWSSTIWATTNKKKTRNTKMLCRLCLQEFKGTGVFLFDDVGKVEEEITLATLTAKWLELELTEDDEVSTVICKKCSQHLNDFYTYAKYVREQQENFCSEIAEVKVEINPTNQFYSIEVEEITTDNRIDNEHMLSGDEDNDMNFVEYISDDQNMEDDYDNENAAEEINVQREIDNETENNNDDVEEDGIDISGDDDNDVDFASDSDDYIPNNERKLKHKATQATKRLNKKEPNRNIFKNTPETFRKCQEFLNTHKLLRCEQCQIVCETFELLLLHYNDAHKCRGYVKCCGRKLKANNHLTDHIKYHMNPKEYECEICNKCFKSRYNLNSHNIKLHTQQTDYKYKCAICNKRYPFKNEYQRHLSYHKDEKNCVCEICEKAFTNQQSLNRHMNVVHKNASYICDQCGKTYRDKNNYVRHVTEHQGIYEKPWQCNVCGDWLKTKVSLQYHMHCHNPIHMECPHCGRVCTTKRSYEAHIHTMHRRASKTCTYCGKIIKSKQKFIEHLAIHTGTKPYACVHCSKVFRSQSNMYMHVKKEHVKEWLASKAKRSKDLGKIAEILENS